MCLLSHVMWTILSFSPLSLCFIHHMPEGLPRVCFLLLFLPDFLREGYPTVPSTSVFPSIIQEGSLPPRVLSHVLETILDSLRNCHVFCHWQRAPKLTFYFRLFSTELTAGTIRKLRGWCLADGHKERARTLSKLKTFGFYILIHCKT